MIFHDMKHFHEISVPLIKRYLMTFMNFQHSESNVTIRYYELSPDAVAPKCPSGLFQALEHSQTPIPGCQAAAEFNTSRVLRCHRAMVVAP